MFTKMMIAYIDVLGSRAKLVKPCQFEAPKLYSKTLQYIYVSLQRTLPSFPVVVP